MNTRNVTATDRPNGFWDRRVGRHPLRLILTLALMLCLVAFLLLSLTWSAVTLAAPGDATLTTTPDKCISLRKGQTCYLKISVDWTHANVGDYCLVQKDKERPLRCWQNANKGATRFELVTKTNATLQLLDMTTGQSVVETQVKLAWVYKERKNSKRSWRLF